MAQVSISGGVAYLIPSSLKVYRTLYHLHQTVNMIVVSLFMLSRWRCRAAAAPAVAVQTGGITVSGSPCFGFQTILTLIC